MNLPPLRAAFVFEDLSVGMTETLEKTVSSSDVVGFAAQPFTRRSQSDPSFGYFAARTWFRQAYRAWALYREPDFHRRARHTLTGAGRDL